MRPTDFLLLFMTIILWAGYYIGGKYALMLFPPFFLSALRFLTVAAVLLPWVGMPNIPMKKVLLLSFLLGVLHFGLSLGALGWGLDLATTIVVSQLNVPFTCMFGAIILQDKLGPWRSLGLIIAMLGAVFVAGTPNVSENYPAFLAALTASFVWGGTNILMKTFGEVKIYPFLGWLGLFSGLQLLGISLATETGQWDAVMHAGWKEIGGVVYVALGSTVLGTGTWYYLLSKYRASQIAPYTMLGPFVSITLAMIFFNEPISNQVIIAGLITIAGVGIIVVRRPRLAVLGKIRRPEDTATTPSDTVSNSADHSNKKED